MGGVELRPCKMQISLLAHNKKETDAAASVSFFHTCSVRQLLRQIRLQLADGHAHPAPRPTSLRGGPDLTFCWGEMNPPQRKILAAPKCLHAASAAEGAGAPSTLSCRLVRQLLRQIRLQLADGHAHPAPRPTSLRGGPDLTFCWGEMNPPQRKILAAPKCLHAASAAEGAGAPSTLPCRF